MRNGSFKSRYMSLAFFSVSLCCMFPAFSYAQAIYYVRAGATGSQSGTDWNTAYSVLPSTLIRGATYYVADGDYSDYSFRTPVDGTKYIVIKKATVEDHGTNVGWQDSYGNGHAVFQGGVEFGSSYWEINGQTGGGPGSYAGGYGFRIAFSGNTGWKLVRFTSPVSNIRLRHIDLSYDYNDALSYPAGNELVATGQDAIYSLYDASDILFQYLRINRPGRTAWLSRGKWNNITIEHCYVRDPVIGYASGSDQHGEIWSANHSAGNLSNVTIRYNWFQNFTSTGGMILSGADGVDIYGNLFEKSTENRANGVIGNWSSQPVSVHVRIHKNTFVKCDAVLGFGNTSGWTVQSNLLVGNHRTILGVGDHDFNFADVPLQEPNGQIVDSSIFVDFAGGDYRLNANGSIDNTWDYDPWPAPEAGILSNVSASSVSTESAVVSWSTDVPASGHVDFGTSVAYGTTAGHADLVTEHTVSLSGLTPDTVYHYQVRSADADGALSVSGDFTFRTLADPDAPPPDPFTGLEGYWKLDEGQGLVASDGSDFGRDGTLLKATGWRSNGRFGGALAFSAADADDYLDLGDFSVSGNRLTLAAWINIAAFGVDSRIIAKTTGHDYHLNYWMLEVTGGTDNPQIGFRVHAGGSLSRIVGGAMETGAWIHVAGVYDGTMMRMYQNGIEVAAMAKSGELRVGDAPVWVGDNPTNKERAFTGLIDELRVYSRALSSAEVAALFESSRPAPLLDFGFQP